MGMNPSHFSNDSPVLNDDSQPIEQTLYENFEKMKNLSGLFLSDDSTICDSVKCMMIIEEPTPSKTQELLAQIASFNALSDFIHREDDHYSSMLHRVQSHVETSTECIQLITKRINDVVKEDENSEESDLYSQSRSKPSSKTSKLKRVQQTGYKLVNVLNDILSELSKASKYIHPDHQKVELFYKTMKELESSVPFPSAEKQLVLDTLPAFLKEELDKLERLKPKRIRSRAEQQALAEQEENVRRNNFADAMERVISLSNEIEEKTNQIQSSTRSEVEALADDQQYIDECCEQIKEYLVNLHDQLHLTKEFLHPSQTVLVQMVHLYNQQQVECQDFKKQLELKEGQIKSFKEMREMRMGSMNSSEEASSKFEDEQKTQEVPRVVRTEQYVTTLEKRYTHIMALYDAKYAEVEHKNDMLYQTDAYVDSLKDDIGDLEYRLGAVMSSAVSNVETRMEAFNDFGIKVQTFEKVMKLIDDTQMHIQQACQDIQSSVDTDLYDIIGETFNDNQHQETTAMLGNVAHACNYILKAFDDIGQEFSGVRQFVHPDREMVERLQTEVISMYETQEVLMTMYFLLLRTLHDQRLVLCGI